MYCENTHAYESVAMGTTLQELCQKVGCPQVLAALVDNKLKSLDYKVINPHNVRFIGYDHPDGRRTYIRSLCFVLQKVVREMFPDKVLVIDYSLPSGLYCEIRELKPLEDGRPNVHFTTDSEIEAIEEHMRGIIAADLPFTKTMMSLDDCCRIFGSQHQSEKVNLIKSFGVFVKNRPAVGCTIAAMGMFLGMQSATTANTIMFATHFGQASLSGLVMMVGFLPMFIFMPFATKLVKKHGKKEVASIGSIAGLVGGAILLTFPLCPKDIQLIVYMCGLVFFGLGMGFYNCVSWAMMGDAIDYQEWKFGKREESVVYALHSFFRKLAQGVGPAAVIAIMGTSLIGYESALGTIGQSAATAKNMCWLVALLYTFSAVCQFVGVALIYNIDKKTLAQMTEELKTRKGE